MPYWFFISVCRLTQPIRWLYNLVPLVSYPPAVFAMQLLFGRTYKFSYVYAQAWLESGRDLNGDFKSKLAKDYHNLFGMGVRPSLYQDGKWNSGKSGEPVFAAYRNDYRGVYDYFNFVYRNKPQYGSWLDRVPIYQFVPDSPHTRSYISSTAGAYRGYGYYTSDAGKYALGVFNLVQDIPYSRFDFGYWLSIISLGIYPVLLWFFVHLFNGLRAKQVPQVKVSNTTNKIVSKGRSYLYR